MTKETLADLIRKYSSQELQEELYQRNTLSVEEVMILDNGIKIPIYHYITIEEFAKEYGGDTLSIYYRDGKQQSFVRLGATKDFSSYPFRTPQNIIFIVDNPPENGTLGFVLNDYR